MRLSPAILLMFLSLSLSAQRHRQETPTNFGMTAPHDEADLPHSRASFSEPVKASEKPEGGWQLAREGSPEWYDATVPGTVLTTLVQQGVYPDPYYGLNNMAIPEDLCRSNWIYLKKLHLDASQLSAKTLELLFNGINYRAEISFNGRPLGRIDGAFTRGRFDITTLAKKENLLLVRILPPPNPGIPHEQSARTGRGPNGGVLCLDGPTFISSEGWDWVPGVRDRNIGIWQDMELIATEGLILGDAQVVTDLPLPSTAYADMTVKVPVRNALSEDRTVRLEAETEGVKMQGEVSVKAGSTAVAVLSARMENPRLWMPVGYGEPNLYDLKLSCFSDGKMSDSKTIRFGVREFSYELTVDAPWQKGLRIEYDPSQGAIFDNLLLRGVGQGVEVPSLKPDVPPTAVKVLEDDGMSPYLVIRVNGVRIFCRGGNWGMDDMCKRVSRERLEPYFKLHRAAGFNMIRNWTGESTEEAFYSLADEYGILVWNDFWISTEGYNLNPQDEPLFMANATDVVRRFRNHPSIAIWCPRNEGYAPESLERTLSEMIAAEDGTRHYHPNSRYCNLRSSGPWHYIKKASWYYTDLAAGFNTELGSPSFPTAESMKSFLPEEDRWPIGDAWHYHDFHPEVKAFEDALNEMYGDPDGLEDFCRKAQMMGYDSYRAMIESWNSRMWNNTSGVLLWMSHPAWPSVEWQTYSWDCETMGSWFGARKACEPLHIQMNLDDRKVVVLNTTYESVAGLSAVAEVYNLQGKCLWHKDFGRFDAAANSLHPLEEVKIPSGKGVRLVRLRLLKAGQVVSLNDYLQPSSGKFLELNSLSAATLRLKALGAGRYELRNVSKTPALAVKLSLWKDGARVLPAIFSEGYFNLLPGEKRTVSVECDAAGPFTITAEAYNELIINK